MSKGSEVIVIVQPIPFASHIHYLKVCKSGQSTSKESVNGSTYPTHEPRFNTKKPLQARDQLEKNLCPQPIPFSRHIYVILVPTYSSPL